MNNSKIEDLEIEIDLEADVPTVRYNDEAYRAKIFRQASEEASAPITQRDAHQAPITQRAIPFK